jgi:mercuric ion transport protein
MAGLAAVGCGVCCGLPVLLGAGALGATAGVLLGSWLVAGIGVAAGAFGFVRWRRRRSCPSDQLDRIVAKPSGGH